MNLDLTPAAPEAQRSLPGLRPIGLDSDVAHLDGALVLATAGDDVFTLRSYLRHGKQRVSRMAATWRNSGPYFRFRERAVADFATIRSLGLERDLRLTRAFVTEASGTGRGEPTILIHGHGLRARDVIDLLPSADGDRDAAVARVADVRAMYGRMLSDVAYRIENSAMFDSAVPTTDQFERALALWASVTEASPVADVLRLAGAVKVTFDTARAHAETIGLAHLPEEARADGRRAASAARLAANAGTPGERAAAWEQVNRILGSLALYYLPDVSRRQLGR